jgi:hypothetical protein
MSGACAAASVGSSARPQLRKAKEWYPAREQGVLMHSMLRQIASETARYRPEVPPDILVVRMDEPLIPSERAIIGGRLLPSAVLELTPGFVPQLIARSWGFKGGAFCLVGDMERDRFTSEMIEACRESGLTVRLVNLRGGVDDRAIEWNG